MFDSPRARGHSCSRTEQVACQPGRRVRTPVRSPPRPFMREFARGQAVSRAPPTYSISTQPSARTHLRMNAPLSPLITRESLIHQLYEAAELEHNLMCTYLYAAFSLKSGVEERLSAAEADATARWRRAILRVAVEEMGHLTAVW